jgi:glycosyltransferase involved in cell wall biosynthesis
MWDNGRAPVRVIEHGIPDPGSRYTGMLPRIACVTNEPIRRGRVTGTDLIPVLAAVAPVDVFGIDTAALTSGSQRHEVIGHGDVPHSAMHDMVSHRRVYAHTCRWTSLGLALLEAMFLGMPVVALSVTEAPESLAGSAAVVSNDLQRLRAAIRDYIHNPARALADGRANRAHVLTRHSLPRFHAEWDRLLKEVLG